MLDSSEKSSYYKYENEFQIIIESWDKMKHNKYRLKAIALLLLFFLTSCGAAREGQENWDSDKITVIATLFPQYDFARQIAGDYVNVEMLLPPGMESHSYDPSPADIISIRNAQVFLYTGPYMEVWAEQVIKDLDEGCLVVNLSQHIPLTKEEDIEAEHDHDERENHAGHNHTYEPHIWTSPVYARIMAEDIGEALKAADPEHAREYEANKKAYLAELDRLDSAIRDMVSQSDKKEIFFGGRFAMYYFTREYGLKYEAAYDSCSSETEPSAKAVAHIVDEMKEKEIGVIYYEELASPRIAKTIAEETGSRMLLWHSCHNVSREDFLSGVTYLDLMWDNVNNLEEGLR